MKALLSGAVGDVAAFFEVSRVTHEAYAQRHGYEYLTGPWDTNGRHAYWMKLAAILEVWNKYDTILWVDADVIITDDAPDILEALPEEKWLGAAEHVTHEGQVFNVGVMVIRTTDKAKEFFTKAWRAYAKYQSHKWPDQAPVMALLGYGTDIPVARGGDTEYTAGLELMGCEWNALPRYGQNGHFLHFAGMGSGQRFGLLQRMLK